MRDLFFLTCGSFAAPRLAVAPVGAGGNPLASERLSNTVAVAVRNDGDLVLVDAGWSAATCAEPVREIGRLQTMALGIRVTAADAIAAQLRVLGFDPARVRAIVATHLHLDHVSGVEDFPNAEVIVSQPELKAYWNRSRLSGYRGRDLARAARIRAVLLESRPTYGFPSSADVFGEGDVVLLEAPGHTAGNVAVALRGPRGAYVHVGDAVYQTWEYGLAPPGPCRLSRRTLWRREDLTRTYGALRSCEADPRRPTVVPSHDAGVFDRLPHTPTATSA